MTLRRRKPTRRARTSSGPLSRDVIAEAGLRLIDGHGIEAFSTRKLGAELGCEAMALYSHFESKDAILDAIVERMLAKVAIPAPESGTWVDRARAYARSFRSLGRIHPRAFPLIATRRFNAPGSLALLEAAFSTFLGEGFDPLLAVKVYRTLANFLVGTTLNEISVAVFAASSPPGSVPVHPGQPSLATVMPYLAPVHFDEVFEFGLDVVLEGCRRAAAKQRGTGLTE
jgi:AcrR family transcriptional regulator